MLKDCVQNEADTLQDHVYPWLRVIGQWLFDWRSAGPAQIGEKLYTKITAGCD